jgi:hypothetical protein
MRGWKALRHGAVDVFDLAFELPVLRAMRVPENREKPASQIRVGLEAIAVGPRFQQRVVNEIVRPIRTSHQRYREGPQGGRRGSNSSLKDVTVVGCGSGRVGSSERTKQGRRRHGDVSPAMRGFGSYVRAQGHLNAPFEVGSSRS